MTEKVRKKSGRVIVWHPKVHQQWGKERRYILRLGFLPTYKREFILEVVDQVFKSHNVFSYKLYETTGIIDLVLNFWLPTIFTLESFRSNLLNELRSLDVINCESFHIAEMLYHWLWAGRDIMQLREPDDAALNRSLSDEYITEINDNILKDKMLLPLCEDNLVAAYVPDDGIKFMITIPAPTSHLPFGAEDALADKIKAILISAENIFDLSFYKGEGFGRFLLAGKVAPAHFDCINSGIIVPINQLNVLELFRARTLTSVVLNTHGDPLRFADRLPISHELFDKGTDAVEALLSKKESDVIEAKGSLQINMKRFYMGDGRMTKDKKVALEGVMRAIVGFLNDKGGHIVIGALERNHFDETKKLKDEALYPRYCDYIIVGVEQEYGQQGWDGFQLQLMDFIKTHITPQVSALLAVRQDILRGKELCIISVRESFEDEWIYLIDEKRNRKFFVRQGNRTEELSGLEADQYKRIKLRERRIKTQSGMERFNSFTRKQ